MYPLINRHSNAEMPVPNRGCGCLCLVPGFFKPVTMGVLYVYFKTIKILRRIIIQALYKFKRQLKKRFIRRHMSIPRAFECYYFKTILNW